MCHVLVIEDEPLVAIDVAAILEEAGATSVDIAATEQEAVRTAQARRPDFICSDIRLTEGTGPRAVEAIRRVYGAVPAMFVTGSPAEWHPCEPDAPILRKPVSGYRLAATFRQLALPAA